MSDDALDSRYRAALSKQLAMNESTWVRLQGLGVDESTQLELDFFYVAASEADAKALGRMLESETDYEVVVGQLEDGESWGVQGATQPTEVSLEVLNQWVDWMITAGLHNGCEFDGWGTEAP